MAISTLLIIAALLILALEVLLLGMGTFFLLFVSVGLMVSGLIMLVGWIPETVPAAVWSVGISTLLATAILWKPLRKLQSKVVVPEAGNLGDFAADVQFKLGNKVDFNGGDSHRYSGIEWTIKSETPLDEGTLVKVVKKEVGVFWVEPVSLS